MFRLYKTSEHNVLSVISNNRKLNYTSFLPIYPKKKEKKTRLIEEPNKKCNIENAPASIKNELQLSIWDLFYMDYCRTRKKTSKFTMK